MNWPSYKEVKNSGVEWIGTTAKHWRVSPVRAAMREVDIRNHQARSQNYLSLMANVGVIPYEEKGDIGNKKPDDLAKCKVVNKNDFVINSMNYQIGSYGVSSYDGVCSPVYIVLRHLPTTSSLRFALRIFETKSFQRYAQSFGNGILEHRRAISWDTLKNLRVPLPPLDEQQTIADFLDRETAKIDALIAKQEQLIAALHEDRTATITLKTDRVGQRVPSLSLLLTGIKDGTHGSFSRVDQAEGRPLLGARNIMSGQLVLDGNESYISETDHLEIVSNGFPRIGDVLLVIVGATIGKSAIYDRDEPLAFQRSVAFLRPGSKLDSKFLWYQTQSGRFQDELWLRSKTSAQPGVYLADVAAIPVFLPSIDEQHHLVAELDRATTKIDLLIAKAEQVIRTLSEYRSTLITDAVTGKIDVRGVA